jgi:hypothetical protein
MKEYHVTGNSWLLDSWRKTSYVYAPRQIIASSVSYSYGERVRFGRDGNSEPHQKHGWAHAAKSGNITYVIGNEASLVFDVDRPGSDVVLKVKLHPYLAGGKLEKQRIIVKVNRLVEGEWTVKNTDAYKLTIPGEHIRTPRLDITFELPDSKSPLELGIGKDNRPRSIIVEWIEMHEQKS